MTSIKRREVKPNSKLGKIIFNGKLPDQYSNTSGKGCEYIFGDPQEDFHYCGHPIYNKRYCEEHHALCYSTKRKTRLQAI